MNNRDALVSLLLKVNDLAVLGWELDVDDVNDLADFMGINGVCAVVRCKDCKHRGYDACPMCFDYDEYDEDYGHEFYVIDRTVDEGFCHKGERVDTKEGKHATD